MKRFDRATYVLFLLILMADVARASASVPVGGGAGGGMILTAASQLQIRPDREVLRMVKGAEAAAPRIAQSRLAQFRNVRLRLSQWPVTVPILSAALLSGLAWPADAGYADWRLAGGERPSLCTGILEHTGSPAP